MEFAHSAEQEELRKLAQKAFAGKDAFVEAQRAGLFDATEFFDICIILEQLGRAGHPIALENAFVGALALQKFAPQLQFPLVVWNDGVDQVPLADRATKILVPGENHLLLIDSPQRELQTPTDESQRWRISYQHAETIPADLAWLRERWTIALCAVELGIAQAQLQMTAEHVMRRQQFGKPIGLFQAVAQRVGDMWVDVESLRLVTWHAAWLLSRERNATREVHTAAYFAAEAGQRIANASQHIHAGIGFDRGYPLYKYFLAAKQIELELGGANRRLAELGEVL
jgi:hypothetical protein